MNEPKICPLLSACDSDSLAYCQGDRCAWYIPPLNARAEGRCAVQALGALPVLASEVRKL